MVSRVLIHGGTQIRDSAREADGLHGYDNAHALGRRSSNVTAAASMCLRNSSGASMPGNVSLVEPVPVT